MGWLQQLFEFIRSLLQWWFTVLPWEQAIRIRLGNRVELFREGIHFKAPLIDRVYVQNVRMRIVALYPQTLTTIDNKTITCAGSVRYRIKDIVKLYETIHQAEGTIRQHTEGLVAEFVVQRTLSDCTPSAISTYVTTKIDLSQYGLNDTKFFLTDFAVVKTLRLVGGDMQRYVGGRELDTETDISSRGQKNG